MADSQLIQGAGQAARAGAAGKLAAGAAFTDAADFISEGTNKVIQARNRNFNSAMKAELAKTGDLTDEEYKKYEKKLRRQRFKYVYLNKRGRAAAEKEVEKDAEELIETKKQKTKIATTTIEDPNRDLGGCNAQALTKIVDGSLEPVKDENGKLGYNMPAGRECYAAEQEELKEFVKFDEDKNAMISSYAEAWDDGRFTLSEDGKSKVDKFGNKYPNTKEGYQSFVDAAEAYWKTKHDETGKKRELDIDTQTGVKSTHAVWESGNENEFNSSSQNKKKKNNNVNVNNDGTVTTSSGSLYQNKPTGYMGAMKMRSPMKMTSPLKAVSQNPEQKEGGQSEDSSGASGSFMSMSDINKMVDDASVDEASFNAIQSIVANTALKAEAIQPGENNEFNYKKNYNNIKQQIVSKGNLRSLAQNTNPFGRIFMEDLAEAIMSTSYEDVGIPSGLKDKAKLESMDPTPKTPINPADAEVIAKTIFQDKKMLTNYVSEYYTNLAEQNFNDNLKPEVAENFDYKITYKDAVGAARKKLGPDRSFTYRGKPYSTSTQQEIQAKNEDEFA